MPKNDRQEAITRREAILRVSAMLGGVALVGQSAMLAGCTLERPNTAAFSEDDIAFLDEIAETILPETGTPGAKAAGVGPFIAMMVVDTYDDREQVVFRRGLETLDNECRDMHGVGFMSATPDQRLTLLEKLDAEQLQYMRTAKKDEPAHYFRMLKELTLLGYFTSETGYTRAMRYIETPGRFDPCTPHTPGEKTWAAHA
ncbi:MAG TPA: gluconate 2-dehydrogenase subunit 3 family protein [Woeseiaceae bacterium]